MSIENGDISSEDLWGDFDGTTINLLGGMETTSGQPVNANQALTHHAVWRAVRMVSADVAKTNIHLYRRDKNDRREREKDHVISGLVRRMPNDSMTAYNFWQGQVLNLTLYGNAYAYIVWGGKEPVSFLPLDPARVYPMRKDGEFYYGYRLPTNEWEVIDPLNILHFRYMTFDGIIGLSPLQYARNTFGLGLAAHKWQSVFFKNGAKLSVVLNHPGSLSADAVMKLKEAFSKLYSGSGNAHSVGVLQEGMDIKPFSVNPKDSQVIELLGANVKEVANIFGIPSSRLGDSSNTSYSSLEQEDKVYLSGALDPLMVCIEQELNTKLFDNTSSYYLEFDRTSWMRPDTATQAAFLSTALAGAPFMSINQARATLNMPSFEDPRFDLPLLPTNNYAPDTTTSNTTSSSADGDLLRIKLNALLGDTVTRAFKRCMNQVKTGEQLQEFYCSYRDKMTPSLDDDFRGVVGMYGAIDGNENEEMLESVKGVFFSAVAEYAAELDKAPKRKQALQADIMLALHERVKEIFKC